jgi:endonuclease YncB( thermonuclease family)
MPFQSVILLLLFLLPLPTTAETLARGVVRLVDGDTVSVLDANKEQHYILLADIDAREPKQSFGKKAKEHLASLIAGKDIRVDWSSVAVVAEWLEPSSTQPKP